MLPTEFYKHYNQNGRETISIILHHVFSWNVDKYYALTRIPIGSFAKKRIDNATVNQKSCYQSFHH